MSRLPDRLRYLWLRHRNGSATPEERREFMEIVRGGAFEEEIKLLIGEEVDGAADVAGEAYGGGSARGEVLEEERAERIFAEVIGREGEGRASWENIAGRRLGEKRRRRFGTVAAAAIVLAVVVGIGVLVRVLHSRGGGAAIVASGAVQHDVAPGKHAAMLTLANGQQIPLDSVNSGAVGRQGNTTVINMAGILSYNDGAKGAGNANGGTTGAASEMLFNTLTTNPGNQYQLVLPDGSRVWLNATSSVRFPVSFGDHQRSVEITGEAYFEVVPDAHRPFFVNHKDMTVQVLGTRFNVNAYADEGAIATTLVDGAVRVARGGDGRLLEPGQQLRLSAEGGMKVLDNVNTDEIVAWTQEEFYFRGADIHSIMRQLSRWYNIKVEYTGNVQERFYAKIPRNVPLSEVLKALAMTGKIHFKTNEHIVLVEP